MPTIDPSETFVLVSQQNGLVIIPSSTLLTRLNYFDGKFLRASDLKTEQEYLRHLVEQSNQAAGLGVARGFDLTLGSGDTLNIGAGLAIDPAGRVLLLPQSVTLNTQELIDKSRELQANLARTISAVGGAFETCESTSTTRSASLLPASELYLIVLSHAEALCGEEDVFGKLCEEACATSTDRPFLLEGVIVRAIPLVLATPLPTSNAVPLTGVHLRSRVASAYFEDERRITASLISKAGLALQTWCLGANPAATSGVPIGVLARAASTTVFIDAWTARRELIYSGAERYWRWRMMMRPWDVFLAQILQFQCQLRDLFRSTPVPAGDVDPCGGALGAVNEAAAAVTELQHFYEATTQRFADLRVIPDASITFTGGSTRLTSLGARLAGVSQSLAAAPRDSLLINGGIVELPSAGYLPVIPGAGATINQQVRQLMGDGVDLRFCVVRPDYVAHALEEAQHMERISLLSGLDHPADKPKVDILVPDGTILEVARTGLRNGFETQLTLLPPFSDLLSPSLSGAPAPGQGERVSQPSLVFNGVTRLAVLPSGGGAIYSAGFIPARQFIVDLASVGETATATARSTAIGGVSGLPRFGPSYGYWLSLTSEKNVFAMSQNEVASVTGRAIIAETATGLSVFADLRVWGEFQVTAPGASAVTGQLSVVGIAIVKHGTAPATTQAQNFHLTTRVVLSSPIAGGSRVDITVQDVSGEDIFFNAEWGKDPITAFAGVTTTRASTSASASTTSNSTARSTISSSTLAVTSELHPNADVYQVTNARHGQAISGLQLVGTALGDTSFVNTASNLLFPQLPPASNELIVRGTRDWVLFHRRRTRQCSVEAKAPPLAPPRQYRLYWQELIDDASLSSKLGIVKNWLHGNGIAPAQPFVLVADVEFQGGVAALISNPGSILTDWPAKTPGNKLIYGAIASTPATAAEGDDLALSRFAQIETVLSSISPPAAAGIESELLPAVPGLAVGAETDGVIVLITSKPVPVTICHTVARILPGSKFEEVRSLAAQGQFGSIFSFPENAIPSDIIVRFNDQTAEAVAGIPAMKAELAKFGPLQAAFVVANPLDAFSVPQAQAIVDQLGGPPVVVEAVSSTGPMPSDFCPVITFVKFQDAPSEVYCSVSPNPLTIASPANKINFGLLQINNRTEFDAIVNRLTPTNPDLFTVLSPTPSALSTGVPIASGGSLPVQIQYTRRRGQPDPGGEDRAQLIIGYSTNNLNCFVAQLVGVLQPGTLVGPGDAIDLVKEQPEQQVKPSADVPAATKEPANTKGAKPAARRKPRKK